MNAPETKVTHTPGPWRTERSPHRNPLLWVVADAPEHGTGIATRGTVDSKTPSEANARLIAAAPELLAALKVAWANMGIPAMDRSARTVDAVILAAIAKAEGGAS